MVCTLSFGEISNIHDGLHIRLASALLNNSDTESDQHPSSEEYEVSGSESSSGDGKLFIHYYWAALPYRVI